MSVGVAIDFIEVRGVVICAVKLVREWLSMWHAAVRFDAASS
jgi:hypothetical protein